MIPSLLLTAALVILPAPPVAMSAHAPIQTGWKPSAYTGDYYRPFQESYRKCVAFREGRFQYWTTGNNNYYEGTYQMTDALMRGAAWMMAPELREQFGDKKGKEIRDKLLETPGHKWHRYYQDQAFYTILNYNSDWSGRHHWGTAC